MVDTIRGRRVTRATLASQLEDAIRLEIIEGELTPGQRLRANDLTRRYGVSATPLREALQRLAAENLVDIDPRLGASVAPISRLDLHDIYWLRELLEGYALERSIARGDADWEARVTRTWEAFLGHAATADDASAEEMLRWSRAHRAFHDALYSAAGSEWLLRFIETLYDHSERYRMLSVRSRLRPTTEDHAGIFRPAIERDATTAVAWLRRHLHNTVTHLESGVPPADDAPAADDEAPVADDGAAG